jgi:hypothetical protein
MLINFNGHNSYPDKYIDISTLEHYTRKRIEDETFFLSNTNPSWYYSQCHVCGKSLYLSRNGLRDEYLLQTSDKVVCKYKNGFKPFDIKLKVPSGYIVFENDMRDLVLSQDDKDDFDVNTTKGTVECVKFYEKRKMVHFIVGNSCPGVYKVKGGDIRIATHGNAKGAKRVGSIITDLWWISAMDLEEYTKKVQSKDKKVEFGGWAQAFKVPVKKGTWAFRFDPNRGCNFKFCDARRISG